MPLQATLILPAHLCKFQQTMHNRWFSNVVQEMSCSVHLDDAHWDYPRSNSIYASSSILGKLFPNLLTTCCKTYGPGAGCIKLFNCDFVVKK